MEPPESYSVRQWQWIGEERVDEEMNEGQFGNLVVDGF